VDLGIQDLQAAASSEELEILETDLEMLISAVLGILDLSVATNLEQVAL
jgi:hypothetical protein